MLLILRVIIVVIYCILVCIFGCIYCLFSPRNPKHVSTFGRMFGRMAPVFGLKVETRKPADAESYGNAIYIANNNGTFTAYAVGEKPTADLSVQVTVYEVKEVS